MEIDKPSGGSGEQNNFPEPYVPELDIQYPDDLHKHIVDIKMTHETVVDENYPFLDKSFSFRFMRRLMHLGIYTLVFALSPLRYGIKIEGRKNLRKHKKLLKNGAMTISNHMHRWDLLFVLQAVRYRMMYFPALKDNLGSSDEDFIRLAGGIPIPTEISLMKLFYQAFDEIVANKKWIHAFPESAQFPYYQPIRPFKKGVFTMALRYNLPIVPIAISYRKPHFPHTLDNIMRSLKGVKQKLPMITVRIGEPLLFDGNLSRKEAVQKMRKECHEAVVRLAGIKNNQHPAEGD